MKRPERSVGQSLSEPVGARAVMVPLDEVEAEGVEWLWPDHIPLGKVTVLSGEGGVGKSLVALDMAARVSRGGPWPAATASQIPHSRLQIEEGLAANVVLLTPEDDLAGTVRPRLEAAGADLARVAEVRVAEASQVLPRRAFALAEHLDAVRHAVGMRGGVRLVVVDPVEAFAGCGRRLRRRDVEAVFSALAELAAETGAAVLAVARRAWPAARAAWTVSADAEVSQRRLLMPVKNTLCSECTGLAFRVVGAAEQPTVPQLAWEPGAVERTPVANGRVAEAAAWLREVLEGGPVLGADVGQRARGAGLSRAALRRAKRRIGVVPYSTGWQRHWMWRLPGGRGGAARGAQLSHIEPHWAPRPQDAENGPIRN